MKQYPHRIAIAHTCIMSGEVEFADAHLSLAQRAVLGYLVSLADCRNARIPVFPSRTTIAKRVGMGIASIYRILTVLASFGYIERLHQGRRQDTGVFARAEIQLSAPLCRLLDLPFADLDRAYGEQPAVDKHYRASPTIDGAYIRNYPVDHLQLSEPQLSSNTDKQAIPSRTEVIRYGRRTVPLELLPLITEGQLRDVQLFTLMAWCRTAGKHLGTLVRAHWSCLRSLRGNALFAYLTKLIGSSSADDRFLHRPSQHVSQFVARNAPPHAQSTPILAIDRVGGKRWRISGNLATCVGSGDSLRLDSPAAEVLRSAIRRGDIQMVPNVPEQTSTHFQRAPSEWRPMPPDIRAELAEHHRSLTQSTSSQVLANRMVVKTKMRLRNDVPRGGAPTCEKNWLTN